MDHVIAYRDFIEFDEVGLFPEQFYLTKCFTYVYEVEEGWRAEVHMPGYHWANYAFDVWVQACQERESQEAQRRLKAVPKEGGS